MENVVKMVNPGAIRHEKNAPSEYFEANDINEINASADTDELMLINSIEAGEAEKMETSADKPYEIPAVISDDPNADIPREHVRSPELRRHGTKLLMTAAAAVGAAAGARLVFGEEAPKALMNSVSQTLTGTFGEIFLRQTLLGSMFLAAEFVLGFFALGDFAVWIAPFLCGAGTVLRLSAYGSPKLLPGALICLVGVIMGAAYSADMSGLLLKLTKGGTVYMDARPRMSYATGFLGCLVAIVLGSILAGVLANV